MNLLSKNPGFLVFFILQSALFAFRFEMRFGVVIIHNVLVVGVVILNAF